MIVPEAHVHSCAELSPALRARLESVKETVSHVLNQIYGPCIFFEHGACASRNLAGGCIDHVHLHALPTEAPVLEAAKQRLDFEDIDGLSGLANWKGTPYIAIEDQAGALHVASGSSLPGQFVRRIVGSVIGAPDEWDYDAFPNYERIQSTISQLKPVFGAINSLEQDVDQRWQQSWSTQPLVYVARAVDNRPRESVTDTGMMWRSKLAAAGFTPVDPVVTPFPRLANGKEEELNTRNFGRIESDLAWLRRSDALVIDMSLEEWSYVGCVCELVYAYLWRIPTIVMTGSSSIEERMWLRYHATKIVRSVEDAIEALSAAIPRG